MWKLLALVLALFCGLTVERPVKSSQLSVANNLFNLGLLHHLYDENQNVFYSPFSISTAFAMLYAGAKGETATQMKNVLGYGSANLMDEQIFSQYKDIMTRIEENSAKKYELSIANKIVVEKNFDVLKTFEERLTDYFKASIDLVDMKDRQTVTQINQWVSKQTHDKIKEILDPKSPLDPSTRMILLNAIYFKGLFQTKFNKTNTKEEVFFNANNSEEKTQMMTRKGKFNYTDVEELDSKLLEIPYTGDDVSLYVLLPNQRQGLKKLNSGLLSWDVVEHSITQLREREVEVMLPKFKVETSYNLNKVMTDLGMKLPFSRAADLSGIDGHQDLKVSQVLHKAYVEVNEEGTEAAAVTAIIVVITGSIDEGPKERLVFRADHPFMFFIRDNKNGMTLFAGHINNFSNV